MSVECTELEITDNPDAKVLGHATLYMPRMQLTLQAKLLRSENKPFSIVPPSRRNMSDTEWVPMYDWDEDIRPRWYAKARDAIQAKMNEQNANPASDDQEFIEEDLPF